MRDGRSGVLLAFAAVLALSSCESSHSESAQNGTIAGTLLVTGGPPFPGGAQAVPGHVKVEGPVSRIVATDDLGAFKRDVPPGSYRLTGETRSFMINGSPGRCAAAKVVTVGEGARTVANVLCYRK